MILLVLQYTIMDLNLKTVQNWRNEYSYDFNGNLTKDLNKNIDMIQYNYLNLPNKVSFWMVVPYPMFMVQMELKSVQYIK